MAGSVMKASMAAERAVTDIEPSSRTQPSPPRCTRHSMSSSIETYWLKTMALPTGSRRVISESSSISASILVELWKRERSRRERMPRRLPRGAPPPPDAPPPRAPAAPAPAAVGAGPGVTKSARAPASPPSAGAPLGSAGCARSIESARQQRGHCAGAPSSSAPTNARAHSRQKACPHEAARMHSTAGS